MKSYLSFLAIFVCSICFSQAEKGYLEFSGDERLLSLVHKKVKNTNSHDTIICYLPAIPKDSLCEKYLKLKGYAILLGRYTTNDSLQHVKKEFLERFPNTITSTSYLRPNFTLLVGSYFTKSSADSDIQSIRKYYPNAILIEQKIICKDSK